MKSFLAIAFALMLLDSVAAGDSTKEAKQHYERGTTAFALGKFAEAAHEYELAYELKADAALLYNAAQANRIAGNKSRALLLYENYLRIHGASVENPEEAARHIAHLKRAIDETAKPQAEAQPQEPSLEVTVLSPRPQSKRPLVKRPWFWVVLSSVVVVAATAAALGAHFGTQERDPTTTLGTLKGN